MLHRKFVSWILVLIIVLFTPLISYASFIETTIGTAVVNDATASYFNPAALMLLQNTQVIPLGTVSRFQTEFRGHSTFVLTNFTESGTSNSVSYYYSPSLYFGMPITDNMTVGLAAVTNLANRDPEENAILRYVQSSNTIQDYNLVPSFGVKINDYLSLGAGINLSYLKLNLQPIVGFPGSNIADSQDNNQSTGSGIGANAGFLLRLAPGTLIGFNYRTITTYTENGTSVLTGATSITSNHYRFQVRTPARSILSISHLITPKLGFITTVQRIQGSIIKNINVYGIATAAGTIPVITNASVPFYLHDTWVFTIGGNYRFQPHWIVRMAATYNQSPSNGTEQISTGNSYIVGASLGYEFNKTITLESSYAHAFIQNESIHINGNRFLINGTNEASRDAVSLKIVINL